MYGKSAKNVGGSSRQAGYCKRHWGFDSCVDIQRVGLRVGGGSCVGSCHDMKIIEHNNVSILNIDVFTENIPKFYHKKIILFFLLRKDASLSLLENPCALGT